MDTNYYKGYLLDDGLYSWELTTTQLRMLDTALFLVDNQCTIRCAALNCDVTKSYLHWWIHNKLPRVSNELHCVVLRVLKFNETKKIGGVNFEKYRKRTIKKRRCRY